MRDSFPDISGGDSERDVRRRATERQRFKKRSRMKGVEDRIDAEGDGREKVQYMEEEEEGRTTDENQRVNGDRTRGEDEKRGSGAKVQLGRWGIGRVIEKVVGMEEKRRGEEERKTKEKQNRIRGEKKKRRGREKYKKTEEDKKRKRRRTRERSRR